jgi:hypothetical protein
MNSGVLKILLRPPSRAYTRLHPRSIMRFSSVVACINLIVRLTFAECWGRYRAGAIFCEALNKTCFTNNHSHL